MLTGAKIAVVLSPAAAGYGLATGAVVIWSIALLVCGIAIGVIAWHESQ